MKPVKKSPFVNEETQFPACPLNLKENLSSKALL
jgi:hypothetical protein